LGASAMQQHYAAAAHPQAVALRHTHSSASTAAVLQVGAEPAPVRTMMYGDGSDAQPPDLRLPGVALGIEGNAMSAVTGGLAAARLHHSSEQYLLQQQHAPGSATAPAGNHCLQRLSASCSGVHRIAAQPVAEAAQAGPSVGDSISVGPQQGPGQPTMLQAKQEPEERFLGNMHAVVQAMQLSPDAGRDGLGAGLCGGAVVPTGVGGHCLSEVLDFQESVDLQETVAFAAGEVNSWAVSTHSARHRDLMNNTNNHALLVCAHSCCTRQRMSCSV
jgi:hypothetical protein